jgi:hypothetical protein
MGTKVRECFVNALLVVVRRTAVARRRPTRTPGDETRDGQEGDSTPPARLAWCDYRRRYSSLRSEVAGTVGFEPTAVGLEVRRSIRAELRALGEDFCGELVRGCGAARRVDAHRDWHGGSERTQCVRERRKTSEASLSEFEPTAVGLEVRRSIRAELRALVEDFCGELVRGCGVPASRRRSSEPRHGGSDGRRKTLESVAGNVRLWSAESEAESVPLFNRRGERVGAWQRVRRLANTGGGSWTRGTRGSESASPV